MIAHTGQKNLGGRIQKVFVQKLKGEPMRPIDADVFEVVTYTGIPEGYNDTFGDGVDWILEKIDSMPTIESERKKGRWIRRLVDCGFNADWNCSRCGWKTSLEEHDYNFCPNCGADMGDKE